jgi:sugar transferase (PEP-CTERM/EpsH1 system associated)
MHDILFLAHRLPYPPDRGDRIRSHALLRAAAEQARVHLFGFVDGVEDLARAEALRPLVASLHVEVRRRGRLAALADALRHRRPLSLALFDSATMRAHVARTLAVEPVSTIFAFSSQMAQFVPEDIAGRRFVMDFVDVDSAKFASYAGAGGLLAPIHAREARLLAAWERAVASRADAALFVSDAEAALFRRAMPEASIVTLGNGVDLDRFSPNADFAPIATGEGPLIVFTGQMDYRPNVDGVSRFVREVLPAIRARVADACFAIVGRSPAAAVRKLAALPGVIVTGEVADVRPWLAAASVVVVPLAIARGVQNKLLEAMAMGRPIVASPAAFAGVDALPGRELIVADGAHQADAIVNLLSDSPRATAMGAAARRQIVARYSWAAMLASLPALLDDEQCAAERVA